MSMERQVVLDTETTGLSYKDGHRVIEIGCVEMISRRLTGRTFHVYLNPEFEVSPGAFQVHGLSNAFLKDKPLFEEVVEPFKEFVAGAELIIHNATFDVNFLDNELMLAKNSWTSIAQHCAILDTLPLARKMHPGQKNNLDALCKRYNVKNTHRTHHGALLDANILAELYLVMTGGQTFLNLEIETNDKAEKVSSTSSFVSIEGLPIIRANAQELLAHEAFLVKTLKKEAKTEKA